MSDGATDLTCFLVFVVMRRFCCCFVVEVGVVCFLEALFWAFAAERCIIKGAAGVVWWGLGCGDGGRLG